MTALCVFYIITGFCTGGTAAMTREIDLYAASNRARPAFLCWQWFKALRKRRNVGRRIQERKEISGRR